MEVNIAEHHVSETLQYLDEFFQPDVDKRGLRLSLEDVSPDGRDLLRVDQFKLNEILTNLIKNAIKYTPEAWDYLLPRPMSKCIMVKSG